MGTEGVCRDRPFLIRRDSRIQRGLREINLFSSEIIWLMKFRNRRGGSSPSRPNIARGFVNARIVD